MKTSAHIESWAAKAPFRITGVTFNSFDCVSVEIADGGHVGRGEGYGVYYLDETPASLLEQVEAVLPEIENGADRAALQELLPPGGARCALDCALWDLEAQRSGKRVWELAGVDVKPVETVYTIGHDTPDGMAANAAQARQFKRLKIKLTPEDPAGRLAAVRAARPDVRLMVDANQGFTFALLKEVLPVLQEHGVELVEQPLPRGGDAELEGFASPIPLCADESCLHLGELDQAAKRYQLINIKLDKAGGLTHGLKLARAALDKGLGLMVGGMGGTSRAMAPAWVVAQLCSWVDLDGPFLIKADRLPAMDYADGEARAVPRGVWG